MVGRCRATAADEAGLLVCYRSGGCGCVRVRVQVVLVDSQDGVGGVPTSATGALAHVWPQPKMRQLESAAGGGEGHGSQGGGQRAEAAREGERGGWDGHTRTR